MQKEVIQPMTGLKIEIYEDGEWDIDGQKHPKPAAVAIIDGKKAVRLSGVKTKFVLDTLMTPEWLEVILARDTVEREALESGSKSNNEAVFKQILANRAGVSSNGKI